MSISDLIAVLALAISLVSLFVSFTTKFSDFANASWENIGRFVFGILWFLTGSLSVLLFTFSVPPPPEMSDWKTIVLGIVVGPLAIVVGILLMVWGIKRERQNQ